ncbi:uncharacterized protein [Vicugna pacos]|uniref:Uncharacterized protein n=1 Tax=Vicugna pacos TaxID=30538 RepID=A0ABM5C7I4_VICPA
MRSKSEKIFNIKLQIVLNTRLWSLDAMWRGGLWRACVSAHACAHVIWPEGLFQSCGSDGSSDLWSPSAGCLITAHLTPATNTLFWGPPHAACPHTEFFLRHLKVSPPSLSAWPLCRLPCESLEVQAVPGQTCSLPLRCPGGPLRTLWAGAGGVGLLGYREHVLTVQVASMKLPVLSWGVRGELTGRQRSQQGAGTLSFRKFTSCHVTFTKHLRALIGAARVPSRKSPTSKLLPPDYTWQLSIRPPYL